MEYQGRTHFNCTKKISNVLVNPVIVLLVSLHSDFKQLNNKKNTPPKKPLVVGYGRSGRVGGGRLW